MAAVPDANKYWHMDVMNWYGVAMPEPWDYYVDRRSLDKQSAKGWLDVRLVATRAKVEGKCSFWLTHNGTRLAHSRDALGLRQHKPELLQALSRIIVGYALERGEVPSKEAFTDAALPWRRVTELQGMDLDDYKAALAWWV
jgi:hypothetical protein